MKKFSSRLLLDLVIVLIVLVISFQVIAFIVLTVGALGLGAFGSNVSESERALRSLEAAANILGLIGALYVANKVYRRLTKEHQKHPKPTE